MKICLRFGQLKKQGRIHDYLCRGRLGRGGNNLGRGSNNLGRGSIDLGRGSIDLGRACSNTNFPTLKIPENAKKPKCDRPTDRPTDTVT